MHEAQEMPFNVPKVTKYDFHPPTWKVEILVGGKEMEVEVGTEDLIAFPRFQACFFEQTSHLLPDISQVEWKRMLGDTERAREEVPQHVRVANVAYNTIENHLEDFLGESRPLGDPELLNVFAGEDETGKFFKYAAFASYLSDNEAGRADADIFRVLKDGGFRNEPRKVGGRVVRVWVKKRQDEAGQSPAP